MVGATLVVALPLYFSIIKYRMIASGLHIP